MSIIIAGGKIIVGAKEVELDEEGYLIDLSDWNREVANDLSSQNNIKLDNEHWEIINYLREYYETYQIAPSSRVLIKLMIKKFGKEKGSGKYLYSLFPLGLIQATRFAGLPKPTC
jgi:tRNA 2-thiouridine synthesizing protein E